MKNHGQQHEEGKIWDTVKKNSKEPKMSSSPSSFSRIPVHSKQQQQGILVNKERANNLEPLALLIERGHAHGHCVQPKKKVNLWPAVQNISSRNWLVFISLIVFENFKLIIDL